VVGVVGEAAIADLGALVGMVMYQWLDLPPHRLGRADLLKKNHLGRES
jgi:hypothetical protein